MTESSPPNHNIAVKRANQSIGIKPVSGKMTLISKRLFHLLIHFIQEDGKQDVYRRSLRSFVSGIGYRSNDLTIVKDALRSLMRTEIEWNSTVHTSRNQSSDKEDDLWISETISNLVSEITVIEKGKGSEVYVEWSFPPKLRDKLLDPKRYTNFFSTYLEIKSLPVLALFEIAERYKTNPVPKTMERPWEWWLSVLTGSTQEMEYKYFKRDVVVRALKELNSIVKDYQLELEERRDFGGRKVTGIQFLIKHTVFEQKPLEKIPTPIDTEIVEKMILIGVPKKDAIKYFNENTEEFLTKTLELVKQRKNNKGLAPLGSEAAYFSSSVKRRFADSLPVLNVVDTGAGTPRPPTVEVFKSTTREKFKVSQMKEAESYFKDLSQQQQDAFVANFFETNSNDTLKNGYKKSQFKSTIFNKAFFEWLASHVWGEPSEEEIAEFDKYLSDEAESERNES